MRISIDVKRIMRIMAELMGLDERLIDYNEVLEHLKAYALRTAMCIGGRKYFYTDYYVGLPPSDYEVLRQSGWLKELEIVYALELQRLAKQKGIMIKGGGGLRVHIVCNPDRKAAGRRVTFWARNTDVPGSGARLEVTRGAQQGERLALSGEEQTLGRRAAGSHADLPIVDETNRVSRQHASIHRDESGWVLVPLSKRAATYLNGQALAVGSPVRLANDDIIGLAHDQDSGGCVVELAMRCEPAPGPAGEETVLVAAPVITREGPDGAGARTRPAPRGPRR